jgi:diacylglycerol kinase (ATP)
MRDAFVIVNPRSRGGGNVEADLRRWLPGATVRRTGRRATVRALTQQAVAAGYPLLVAAGGDGTLNAVLNAVGPFLDRLRLGLLPLGTGNDFARSVGMPDDLAGAVEVLRQGQVRRCDAVSFRQGRFRRLFLNVSAGGFSAEVGDNLTAARKQSWGPLAYFVAALESLPARVDYDLTLTFDGGPPILERSFGLAVANGRYVAGGLAVAPYAELDDGVFDVVVSRSVSLPALAGLASRALLGRHLEDPDERVLFRQARRLEVRAQPALPLNVDGEDVGERCGVFEIAAGVVQMIVAPGAPALRSEAARGLLPAAAHAATAPGAPVPAAADDALTQLSRRPPGTTSPTS